MRLTSFIVLTSLLMFSACTKPETTYTEFPLLFRFGESVYVSEGFYKGCHGHITDYRHYYDGNVYTVDAECTSVNGSYSAKKVLSSIQEKDLVEDDSN